MSLEHMLRDEQESLDFLLREEFEMELEEIEQEIEKRLGKLQTRRAESFEIPSWGEWLECYNALAQVKQAQALETIAGNLEKVYVSSDENFDLQDIAKKLASIAAILRDK